MKAFVKIVFAMALILIFTVFSYAQDSARECLQKGLSYEAKGMFNEALSEYKKAVSLDPTYSDAFFNIGLICYRGHQWVESS